MTPTIYWTLVDSRSAPLETEGVLCPSELQKFSAFRFPKRRNDWLLGRWTAKSLAHGLPAFHDHSLDQIEIHTTPQGAPLIQIAGEITPEHCLSISHSGGFAFCALATEAGLRLGADLEKIEMRTETFVMDYFTPGERQIVAGCPAETRARFVTLIWSAKEAMLKALGVGLHQDTRSVEVQRVADIVNGNITDWKKVQLGETQIGGHAWAGWWQPRDQFILTLAGYPASKKVKRSILLVEKDF
jgi:4'-phosphopantetheinyl transferase